MKTKYDFSKGRRGAVRPPSGKKVRITIRLDRDIVDWFRSRVEEQGGGNYQTMLNDAFRTYMEREEQPLKISSVVSCARNCKRPVSDCESYGNKSEIVNRNALETGEERGVESPMDSA